MLPDNRIRYPSTKIDFDADVGVTGQDHDEYPAPGTQSRFDYMRMALIGLLAQQSSFSEPSQYRDGTPWFDLNTFTLKIYRDGAWRPYSSAIPLTEEDESGDVVTLAEWYTATTTALDSIAPEIVFSGTCTDDDITAINIPTSLRSGLFTDSRTFVYKNGGLLDPRTTRLDPGSNPTSVKLLVDTLDDADTFVVVIKRIPSTTFYSSSVSIP